VDEQQYLAQTRQYFDDLAPSWDNTCRHDESKLHLIIGLASPATDSRLLDIGCGTGVMIAPLLATEPRELVAVDLAPRMIEIAAQKYRDPRLRLIGGDFFALEESGFDLTLLYSVYPHFPHKRQLALKTAQCLKEGGRFLVAHSESRAIINSRHQGSAAQLSQPLQEAKEEAAAWQEYFHIDMLIDTERLYVISGLRK